VRLAQEGLALAREALKGTWDLVILDEINVAVEYGLVGLSDVLALLEMRRAETDMVLTGRGAHPELVRRADMVSEVLEIKHHYQRGIAARKGIEY
jgi:cob(I)alamin adenosyltransferase